MSTPWAQGVVLTSTGTTSPSIALDPLSKMTVVQVSAGSSSLVGTAWVQATLDTPAWGAATATPQPSPQPIWSVVGSSIGYTSSDNGGLSTFDNTAMFVLLQPISGLRLNSSAAIASGNTFTLRALQSPSA